MPTLLRQSRYKPMLPFVPPAMLTPGSDDTQSLAVNPRFADALAGVNDTDQDWRGGSQDNTPPVPPVEAKQSSMPPPGVGSTPNQAPRPTGPPGVQQPAAAATAPAPAPAAMGPPAAVPSSAPSSPDEQRTQDIAEMQATPPEPAAPAAPEEDLDAQRKAALKKTQDLSTPTPYTSNWAQRLGMALLASTKLAPVANMIVHPKWTEQERARQTGLAAAEGQLKDIETAENISSLADTREAQAEQRRREKARENYIPVPGGGLFNTNTKTWERQPADKSQLTQISKEQADANGIQPLADGTYAIPNTAVGSLISSNKDKSVKTIEERLVQVMSDDTLTPDQKTQQQQQLVQAHNLLHPQTPIHGIESDAQGNSTLVVADPSNPTQVQKIPLGKIGKPQPANDTAARAVDKRNDTSYQFNIGELNKLGKPIEDLGLRLGRLEDTISQNSPQADALIAPELLTVMAGGAGSGLRMNEAEIARIVGGRSVWESLKASINKWQLDPAAARSITPAQQQQIRALVTQVGTKIRAKQSTIDDARGALLNAQSPEEHRAIVSNAHRAITGIDQGGAAAAAKPIVQHSPSTGAYRYSTDGGKTWLPGQPPQ